MWADTIGQCGQTPYGTMGRHHRTLPTFTTFITYFFPTFTTCISYFYQLSQLLLATLTTFISYFYQLLLLLATLGRHHRAMWADTIGHYGPTPYGTMGRHHRCPMVSADGALWCLPILPYGVCPYGALWCPMVSAHGALC